LKLHGDALASALSLDGRSNVADGHGRGVGVHLSMSRS
jgi:hypothetical protein